MLKNYKCLPINTQIEIKGGFHDPLRAFPIGFRTRVFGHVIAADGRIIYRAKNAHGLIDTIYAGFIFELKPKRNLPDWW